MTSPNQYPDNGQPYPYETERQEQVTAAVSELIGDINNVLVELSPWQVENIQVAQGTLAAFFCNQDPDVADTLADPHLGDIALSQALVAINRMEMGFGERSAAWKYLRKVNKRRLQKLYQQEHQGLHGILLRIAEATNWEQFDERAYGGAVIVQQTVCTVHPEYGVMDNWRRNGKPAAGAPEPVRKVAAGKAFPFICIESVVHYVTHVNWGDDYVRRFENAKTLAATAFQVMHHGLNLPPQFSREASGALTEDSLFVGQDEKPIPLDQRGSGLDVAAWREMMMGFVDNIMALGVPDAVAIAACMGNVNLGRYSLDQLVSMIPEAREYFAAQAAKYSASPADPYALF